MADTELHKSYLKIGVSSDISVSTAHFIKTNIFSSYVCYYNGIDYTISSRETVFIIESIFVR